MSALHAIEDEDTPLDIESPASYDNGLKCVWAGRRVKDMSRDELIAFIGLLDSSLTSLYERLKLITH